MGIRTADGDVKTAQDALDEIAEAVKDAQLAFSEIAVLAHDIDASNWEEKAETILGIAYDRC